MPYFCNTCPQPLNDAQIGGSFVIIRFEKL